MLSSVSDKQLKVTTKKSLVKYMLIQSNLCVRYICDEMHIMLLTQAVL